MSVVCRRPGREILIAVPTRGQIQWATVTRLQQIRDAEKGLPPVFYRAGHLSVAEVRNDIAEHFLAGGWKVLVMVDDDVVPHERLLQVTDLIPEHGIVAVPTLALMGQAGLAAAVFRDGRPVIRPKSEIEEVDSVGFGCVAISRELLEAVGTRPFKLGYEGGRVVSDDIMFCALAHEHGFSIAADFRIAADHHPSVSLAQIAGIGGIG